MRTMNNAANTTIHHADSPFHIMCERLMDMPKQAQYKEIDRAFGAKEINYQTAKVLWSMTDRLAD